MTANSQVQDIGPLKMILRSRIARGFFRIHVGCAFVRSWAMDVQIPGGTSLHLFDYLLYRRIDREVSSEKWLKTRELLSP